MIWLSVGLGAGIGFLYAIASYANARFAAGFRTHSRFMAVFFGGMLLRMMAALALVAFVIVFVPVHVPVFIAAFLAAFLIGLVTEVAKIHQEATARWHDK